MTPHEGSSERGAARANASLSRRAFVKGMTGLGVAAVIGCSPSPARKLRRIGWLSGNAEASVKSLSQPFFKRLTELGYVEGRDFETIWMIPNPPDNSKLPDMAAELVAMPVDILIAEAQPAQAAAKGATDTIPIVFVLAADPVGEGLIASYARPGRNITGVSTGSMLASGKRVERLKQTVPGLSSLAVVWNTKQPAMFRTMVQPTGDAAFGLHMQPRVIGVGNEAQLNAALDIIAREGLESLVLLPAVSLAPDKLNLVPDFAAKIKIPQIYADEDMVRKGAGLMSFNSNRAAQFQRAAEFVDKILKGVRPEDIPAEEPTQIDFIVNLLAAKRIGLDFPPRVLGLATDIIR